MLINANQLSPKKFRTKVKLGGWNYHYYALMKSHTKRWNASQIYIEFITSFFFPFAMGNELLRKGGQEEAKVGLESHQK